MTIKTDVINENIDNDVFVQIMPAPQNIYTAHKDEQGEFYTPVVCIALRNDGDIVFCDSDSSGMIEDIKHGDLRKYNPETNAYDYL